MGQMASSGTTQATHVLSGNTQFEIVCPDTLAITRDEWLDLRREGLGGSDIAPAMGLSPFTSRYALYLDKIGEGSEFEPSEFMKWGHRLESPIAVAFWEETGFQVWSQPVMLRSRACPFALANPDRFTQDEDGPAIVEVKNIGNHKAHEWVDGPPMHYRLQGQWYLFVTGYQRVYYAVLIGGQNFVIYQVERDDDLIARMLKEAEAFWTRVTLRRPPDLDGEDSTTNALKAQYSTIERSSVDGGVALASLVLSRQAAKAVADTASAQLQEIDNRIVALLGDAEVGTADERELVKRAQQSRTTIDADALRRDYPEIATEYSKTTTFRKLSFPRAKEA